MSDAKPEPILDLKFLSHGTLEVHDIEKSARFYTEFLGLEFALTTPMSGMVRLGGQHVYVVVQGGKSKDMPYTNHNGIDVATKEDVDRAHALCREHKDKYEIKGITKPKDMHQVYGFYFRDRDSNWWEILNNPDGGYTWRFDKYLKEPPAELPPGYGKKSKQ